MNISVNFCEVDWEILGAWVSSLIALIAVILYWLSFRQMQFQNEMLLSQNIKNFYEKEIEALEKDGQELEFTIYSTDGFFNRYPLKNLFEQVIKCLDKIRDNPEYKEDYQKMERGMLLTNTYLERRSYFGCLRFVRSFDQLGKWPNYFQKVVDLKTEINESQLIQSHKNSLQNKIDREIFQFFKDGFIRLSIFPSIYNLTLPYRAFNTTKVEWKKLSETEVYKVFNKTLYK